MHTRKGGRPRWCLLKSQHMRPEDNICPFRWFATTLIPRDIVLQDDGKTPAVQPHGVDWRIEPKLRDEEALRWRP